MPPVRENGSDLDLSADRFKKNMERGGIKYVLGYLRNENGKGRGEFCVIPTLLSLFRRYLEYVSW